MALFFNLQLGLVLILIGLLSIGENGIRLLPAVSADGTMQIPNPEFIKIEIPPPFHLSIADPSQPHYLHCQINQPWSKSFPAQFYKWFRNGEKLHTGNGRRNDFEMLPNGTLKLPPKEKAAGRYQCLVNSTLWNLNATISGESHVEYPVLKGIRANRQNVTVTRGDFIVLSCPFVSVPLANVTWYFEKISIAKRMRENRYIHLSNGSLVIKNLNGNDRGSYKCVAENQFAQKTHRQFLWNLVVVPQKKDDSTMQPKLDLLPSLQNVTMHIPLGGHLHLKCDGAAKAIEWWFKPNEEGEVLKIQNNSRDLDVYGAQTNDSGIYSCVTENNSNQTFTIIVTEPPIIATPLISYEASLSAVFSLNCTASGSPPPTYVWYRNGAPFTNSFAVNTNSSILAFRSFDIADEGIYQCFARNIVGEATSSAIVKILSTIEYFPPEPKNVKCLPVNFMTVNITFEGGVRGVMHLYIREKMPFSLSGRVQEVSTGTHFVVDKGVPLFKEFYVSLRNLYTIAISEMGNEIQSSLLSHPVNCATQGLPITFRRISYNIYVKWTVRPVNVKYFVIQMKENNSISSLASKFNDKVYGTLANFDSMELLSTVRNTSSIRILHSANENNDAKQADEEIFNLVVFSNVTGVFIPMSSNVFVRVLSITEDNEDFDQDLRYVEWHRISDTTPPIRIKSIESRRVIFSLEPELNITCIEACYILMIFENLKPKDGRTCVPFRFALPPIQPPDMIIDNLKQKSDYHFNFVECGMNRKHLHELEFETKSDPPSTILIKRISKKDGGLLLTWNPPKNPNENIEYYKVIWTNRNVTNEANINAKETSFKFPNVGKDDKMNISVYVFSSTGASPPIYLDLTDISLPDDDIHSDYAWYWPAIVIGVLLSTTCFVLIACGVCWYRKRLKRSNQALSLHSDVNLLNQTPVSYHFGGGNASGSGAISQEYHEMQTLIPQGQNVQVLKTNRLNGSATHAASIFCSTPKVESNREFNDMSLDDKPSINFESLTAQTDFNSGADARCIPPNQSSRFFRHKNSSSPIFSKETFNSNSSMLKKTNTCFEDDVIGNDVRNDHSSGNHVPEFKISTVAMAEAGQNHLFEEEQKIGVNRMSQGDESVPRNSNGIPKPNLNNNSYQRLNSDNTLILTKTDVDFNLSNVPLVTDVGTSTSPCTTSSHKRNNWSHRRPVIDPNG